MSDREKFLAGLAVEDREALASVFDKAVMSEKSGRASFTAFLSEREYAQFLLRKKYIGVPFVSFGGYENAMRLMVCFSEEEEQFPIEAVRVLGRGVSDLKHPDLLGSLMSLGIERKSIGDIVKCDDEWIIFAQSTISGYIKESLFAVGGVSVKCETALLDEIDVKCEFEEITGTVQSLRADSVVSVMLKTSRSKAAEFISGQKFFLNQLLCTKCDKEIKENDILTIRHHGKARVTDVNGRSKKGRIFITLQKYK